VGHRLEICAFRFISRPIVLVGTQLVVELPVYSNESFGCGHVEDLKRFVIPCEIDLSRLHTEFCSSSELPARP
jgi:hypothetical protein